MTERYSSAAKLIVLLIYFFIFRQYLYADLLPNIDFVDQHSPVIRKIGSVIYVIVFYCVVTSSISIPFFSSSILRFPLTFVSSLSWSAIVFYAGLATGGMPGSSDIQSSYLDIYSLALFWSERHLFFAFIETYPTELFFALITSFSLFIVLMWPPSKKHCLSRKWNIIFCLPLLGAIAIAIYTLGGTYQFPEPVGLPIRIASAIIRSNMDKASYEGTETRPVSLTPGRPIFHKIVFIMDESVRSGFVDFEPISRESLRNQSIGIIDFGETTSGGNCSHTSRFIFRHGMRPSQLPDAYNQNVPFSEDPTIWQYAKTAGFKTIHIDALGEVSFHDDMTKAEARNIDQEFRILIYPKYNRDVEALSALKSALATPEPAFIYVDKQGVHSPYQEKYPPTFVSPFKTTHVRNPPDPTLIGYATLLIDHYRNAVGWSVDRFLINLVSETLPDNVLIIYTSDHGQSMMEGGYKLTHCSSGPNVVNGEGLVPLFIIGSKRSDFWNDLHSRSQLFKNKYTHFEVFPTLLRAMGYSRIETAKRYGGTLLDKAPMTRKFLKGGAPGGTQNFEWQVVN